MPLTQIISNDSGCTTQWHVYLNIGSAAWFTKLQFWCPGCPVLKCPIRLLTFGKIELCNLSGCWWNEWNWHNIPLLLVNSGQFIKMCMHKEHLSSCFIAARFHPTPDVWSETSQLRWILIAYQPFYYTLGILACLLRMVMGPKYLSEEVIIHPLLIIWQGEPGSLVILLMEDILHHLRCTAKNPRYEFGINYQPQLVSRVSSINSMDYFHTYFSIPVFFLGTVKSRSSRWQPMTWLASRRGHFGRCEVSGSLDRS